MVDATLDSAEAVIAALGGASEVRRLTGVSRQAVWNWKRRNRFSARIFQQMTTELRERGFDADGRLWGQA